MPCHPNPQEFLVSGGRSDTIMGRELRGHVFWNKFVDLFSFWFCRLELWQDPREAPAGEEKSPYFLLFPTAFFCLDSANQSCFVLQAQAAAPVPLWLPGCRCPDSVRFLQFYYFSPRKPFFFNFSLFFTRVIPIKLFAFLPIPTTFYYFSVASSLLFSPPTAVFWKMSLTFEQ